MEGRTALKFWLLLFSVSNALLGNAANVEAYHHSKNADQIGHYEMLVGIASSEQMQESRNGLGYNANAQANG
jgi:hypothetical protein